MQTTPNEVILFIDSNQYLKLWGLIAGKKLLDALDEQREHIFVSSQVVGEVMRNKLRCAQAFFSDKLKQVDEMKSAIPDHMLGIPEQRISEFREIFRAAHERKNELSEIATGILDRISRSEDDVSQRLQALFDRAVSASLVELQRARDRKERGDPPGKKQDPLGDQITWEQLLSFSAGSRRVWLITDDRDFHVKHGNLCILNSLLFRDLGAVCASGFEIYCFSDLLEGLNHFGKNAGVTADNLPSPEESNKIREELDALPPMGWLQTNDISMNAVEAAHLQRQRMAALIAAGSGGFNSILPFEQGGGGLVGRPGVEPPKEC